MTNAFRVLQFSHFCCHLPNSITETAFQFQLVFFCTFLFFSEEEAILLVLLPLLITESSHAFTATRPSSSTVHICRLGKGEGRHYVGRLPLHFSHFSAICNFSSSSCCCPTCKITFFVHRRITQYS